MRLFVAINLPLDVCEYLKSVQKQLPSASMRFVQDFHITLQFIGDVSLEKAMEIKSALFYVFMPRMKLKLEKIGVFGDRVVWVGLEVPEELKRVQSEVEEQLAPLGFFNDKPFKPHLTLARAKDGFAGFEKNLEKIEVVPMEFEVNTFSLMESHLSSDGAKYEEIENYVS